MNKQKKMFVSEIDKFLTKINADQEASKQRLIEVAQYKKLNRLRDDPNYAKQGKSIWTDF